MVQRAYEGNLRVSGAQQIADLDVNQTGDGLTIRATGNWLVGNLARIDSDLRALRVPRGVKAEIDVSDLEKADTMGAWLIERTRQALAFQGSCQITGAEPALTQLMKQVGDAYVESDSSPQRSLSFIASVNGLGASIINAGSELLNLVGFTGRVVGTMLNWIIRPRRIRLTPVVYHMEQVGLNAVPIIALISILIGAVLAFLGSDLMADFGAQVFVVNLVSFAFLREFGVLLTAIMVAGRSGSAFTAQIGSMKGREEIDAMSVLGLDYVELLVVPRVIAMIICLPLLTFVSDIMGLLGGGIVLYALEGMSPALYFTRLENVTEIAHFNVGMIKSVFFAAAISIIGCYQGLKVEGSAESVGQRTTLSVVEAIFTVIVLDALFAIYFIEIGY